MEAVEIDELLEIYKGKKVLVTGHTGFKGAWLSIWLNKIGAEVIGISLDPRTEKDIFCLSRIGKRIKDYRADIRNIHQLSEIISAEEPEVLFHLAAQPIVLESYQNPLYTFETNVLGTVNLLECFRTAHSLKTGVFITTDKCYDNIESHYAYKETDPMGGHDPYSSSKGAAELIISSYRKSFFSDNEKKVASVRAGNVIGGGDWTPNRLMVDIVKSIETNQPLIVRKPLATRPWQHVLEPLSGYLLLGAKMMAEKGFDEAWNFGPNNENTITVKEVIDLSFQEFGSGVWIDESDKGKPHEAQLLALDISKAKTKIGWIPRLNLHETIKLTIDWYMHYSVTDVLDLSISQIELYTKKWKL